MNRNLAGEPSPRTHADLAALEALTVTAELEHLVITAEHTTGLTPPGMTRPLFDWETTARVDFAAIDRILTQAYAAAATALDGVRDVIVAALAQALGGRTNPRDIVRALNEFAATQPPDVRDAIATATAQISRTLTDLYARAGGQLLGEAEKQGVPAVVVGPARTALARAVLVARRTGLFDPPAAAGPMTVWQRLSAAAVAVDGSRPATGPAIVSGVAGTGIDAAYDVARQAAHVAHGLARKAAVDALPEPKAVYASELLDRNTCRNCDGVDGREYTTMEEGLVDYPDAGPYKGCLGGDRCRGTLVLVWGEADPTVR